MPSRRVVLTIITFYSISTYGRLRRAVLSLRRGSFLSYANAKRQNSYRFVTIRSPASLIHTGAGFGPSPVRQRAMTNDCGAGVEIKVKSGEY